VKRIALSLATAFVSANLAAGQSVPAADYHQHIFSPALAALVRPGSPGFNARDLVALLDSAGIRRAILLSAAYMYGSPARTVHDGYAEVRAENDWNASQAAEYPDRLRAFCSFNPLKEYALEELDRCARIPNLSHGIKLHFGNSDVQLDNPEHVERLKRVFRAANDHHMAIVVHLRASVSRKRPYGAAQARVFLDELLPLASDIDVQVAHLAGTGPGYDDPPADSAMAVLAKAVQRHDPRTRRLWFDVATVVDTGISPAQAALVVKRIRQVGVERILYGSDAPVGENLRPREGWAAFRRLPLTEKEFDRIASNVTPYLNDSASEWTPLFNGRDLTGWEHVGPGRFVVEDGVLKTEGGMGLLWYTPRKLGQCRVRVVFRTDRREGNSGIFIRIPEKPTEPWMPVNRGYEVQIDDSEDDYHVTGVLYSLTKAMARSGRPGEWNEMEIGLDGARTWVKLNGTLVTDYMEGSPTPPKREQWEPDRGPRPDEGYIGLQNHGEGDTVYFREVSVTPGQGR
jgi:predicted TIM-barrel fold metal-dependent hydrolase